MCAYCGRFHYDLRLFVMVRVRAGRSYSFLKRIGSSLRESPDHAWDKHRALARHGASQIVIAWSECFADHCCCELRHTSGFSDDAVFEHCCHPWLCRLEPESHDRWQQPCACLGTWTQLPSSIDDPPPLPQWMV